MNEITAIGGNAIALTDLMQPFAAAAPFEAVLEAVEENSTPRRRSHNERRSAAVAIKKAVTDQELEAINLAHDHISKVLAPAGEVHIRDILAVMFETFPNAQLTPASSTFLHTMVFEIREDGLCTAAIASAARECWRTMPSPPAISTFLQIASKHQRRLETVQERLGSVGKAVTWAEDVVEDMKLTPDQRFERDFGYTPAEWARLPKGSA